MRLTKGLFLGLALAGASLGLLRAQDNVIRIAGSDLLGTAVQELLEQFGAQQNIKFVYEMDGTIPALKDLKANKAEVAIVGRPTQDPVSTPPGFVSRPFCAEVVYVAVNAANPLTEISLRQLSAIYSQRAESAAERWGIAGMTGEWAMRPLLAFMPSQSTRLSVEIFKNYVFGKDDRFKPGVRTLDTHELMLTTIGLQNGAIGFFSTPLLRANPSLKILPISTAKAGQQSAAFSPTLENVYLGDYPLRLPFELVLPEKRDAKMTALLHYLYGDEFSEALQAKGFMPLPASMRKNTTLAIDKNQ